MLSECQAFSSDSQDFQYSARRACPIRRLVMFRPQPRQIASERGLASSSSAAKARSVGPYQARK